MRMKFLLPFSWLYAFAVIVRNKLFDWGVLKPEDAGVPVISVGNLTVGGTGKTPLVEYIVTYLLREGRRVGVVSRGYKRKSTGVVVVSDGKKIVGTTEEGGDEPLQIAHKFPDAIVVVAESRVEAARQAVQCGADVVVMDDGFQHRYLKRDLDIVVVDATKDVLRDAVLPAGMLREPLSGLRRAHMVALSRFNENDPEHAGLEKKLSTYTTAPFTRFQYTLQEIRRVHDDGLASPDVVKRMSLIAFSGIGNHESFTTQLREAGFNPLNDMRFSDHHRYSEADMLTLASFAKAMNVDGCITTEKDAVRIRSDKTIAQKLIDEVPVFYTTIHVEIVGGQDTLHSSISSTTRGKAIS
ncbi:MAG: tetraacyldisaccharide 4'-kinase [Bacteroidetes bacterium]|nr:tetraacyldisaccharide 4'-kinase [Bacteroidota bacterium]MCW5895409.1 tetraacyldisaccharide 4'-kinase [Bacteroidota bacterium]